jgi:hypothetical protein
MVKKVNYPLHCVNWNKQQLSLSINLNDNYVTLGVNSWLILIAVDTIPNDVIPVMTQTLPFIVTSPNHPGRCLLFRRVISQRKALKQSALPIIRTSCI